MEHVLTYLSSSATIYMIQPHLKDSFMEPHLEEGSHLLNLIIDIDFYTIKAGTLKKSKYLTRVIQIISDIQL